MNSLEINKIVGAVLLAVLAMTVISFFANYLIPEGAEGVVASAEHATEAPAGDAAKTAEPAPAKEVVAVAAAAAAVAPIAARLAAADVEAGAKVARKCLGCHSLDKGGRNKVGPNLWGVVGRDKGSVAGFGYSGGMIAKGGSWSYADLDTFLTNPKAFVAKTKMGFKVKKPGDRANVILFLRTLADAPVPLPPPSSGQ